jgi:SAM-dependent methyltransferase
MKTRADLLNHLAEKYNLQTYLEIGVQDRKQNFDKIICKTKCGVDPDPAANASCQCTSDEFFSINDPISRVDVTSCQDDTHKFLESENRFDLIFIDGLHTAEQVKKDFENALRFLKPHGFIVLHDCNPLKEEHTIVPRPTKTGHWNGDVWKFAVALNGYDELIRHTVDVDNGCMVLGNTGKEWMYPLFRISEMSWSHFDKNRKKLLNLISWDEFIRIDSHV